MPTITQLEDLQVWQEARFLAKMIYSFTSDLPKSEEYNLKRHLKENARGLPANIAEGFYRYFKKERLHFYGIAKGCLGEIKNDICLCTDFEYIKEETNFKKYLEQINKVERMLNSFIGCTSKSTQK